MHEDDEYRALVTGPAFVVRSYRALLEVTGADRASWLHNLTTNQVKNLGAGEGNYAFVLNVQGRILFDVNVLVRAESIWLDLDRRFLETAKKHFSKYAITEDVTVVDRSAEFVRFGLVGPKAVALIAELGAPNALALPTLGQSAIEWNDPNRRRQDQGRRREPADTNVDQNRDCQGTVHAAATVSRSMPVTVLVVRHDFCGPFAVELFVPTECADEFRRAMIEPHRAIPVGDDAVQVLRIEAGIPWPGHEITEEYLPAETRQLERAVNYQKGCYLGQEVVERMRSRHVVARQLVGLRIDGPAIPALKSEISDPGGKPIGQVTSVCRSIALQSAVGLGYVKTSSSAAATPLRLTWADGAADSVVVNLPFTSLP